MLPRIPALLLLAAPALAAFKNDFSDYPSGTRDCLESADEKSGCDGDDAEEMNACLCSNEGNFLFNTASCVGADSHDDVGALYDLLTVNCDGTSTPLEFSEDEFQEVADSAHAANPDPAEPNPPNPPGAPGAASQKSGGLSAGAKAGIAVGAVGAVALIGLGVWLFRRRRQASRTADESNPMLGVTPGVSMDPSAATRSTAYVSPYQDSKSPAWGPDSISAMTTPTPQWRGPEAGSNEIYELPSAQGTPVEMPGSQPVAKP